MAFDLYFPADTTVCGMSSWLVQVTVSPTFTFSSAGVKVKLSMVTLSSSALADAMPRRMVAATANPRLRKAANVISVVLVFLFSARQRRVDDREALVALLEVDAGDAEHAAQLGVLDLHRTGRGGCARRRLRERG